MELINRISKEKNGQYKVHVESGTTFFVSEDVLIKMRLLKGTEIDQETIEQVKKESQLDHGYQLALNYLSYQLRSRKEIEDYLYEKEISRESIAAIVLRLQDLKLVDDVVYGESYVRTMMRTSDKGPRVVNQQLKKRGLKPFVIEQVMELYTIDEQLRVCKEVAIKALKKYRQKSHSEKLQKTRQFLLTKGFSTEIVKLVLEDLEIAKDEEQEEDILRSQGEKLWQKNKRFAPQKRKQKVTQSLFQKGFNYGDIQEFMHEKEMEDDE